MNFEDYIEKYPQKKKRLEKYKLEGRMAENMLDLRSNEAFNRLEKELLDAIDAINHDLLFKMDMTKEHRDKLMIERHCWSWLLRQFGNAEKKLKSIDNYLKTL